MERHAGQILLSSDEGHYRLRLQGDVRLTLCHLIEEQINLICAAPELQSVAVDVGPAQGIDSTTLGLLAKLGLRVKSERGMAVTVYSPNPSITRLFRSMCLQDVLDLRETAAPDISGEFRLISPDESTSLPKSTVVEAHQTLMDLSSENEARFKELMKTLTAP
ncbi:MAG: anti-anti-sigma factor [Gammaproteobacteria bacterium]|nr:MAG: anti-anti-sigma factor [Gammaproteobacteria bacterium]